MNKDLKAISTDIRCDILRCIGHLGVGHIGGCLSVVELLAVLYFEEMNIDPANPKMPGRDRFVCSKGQCHFTTRFKICEKWGMICTESLIQIHDNFFVFFISQFPGFFN